MPANVSARQRPGYQSGSKDVDRVFDRLNRLFVHVVGQRWNHRALGRLAEEDRPSDRDEEEKEEEVEE